VSATVRQGALASSAQGHIAATGANVDWPLWGNDTNNTHYSALTQINAGNVSQLGIAWTQQEGAKQTTFETVPLVVKGVMYYTTNSNQVRAVNAATGKLIWQYTPKVNFYEAIAGGGGGVPTNRSVTVSNNKVYLLTFDDHLIALQQSTGEKLWDSTVADANQGFSEVSPPTYWNGMLFVGSAEGDSGHRGFIAAYDANSGKKMWTYYTVPADGQGWVKKGSGVTGGDVWMPVIIDSKTGILYAGAGNPYPDFDNSKRLGCDPWVNATIALKAKTGKFIWGHSEVCNDITDYDSDPSPMIFDMTIHGKTVHAVGHANKSGLYFIYDAATGKVLAQTTHVTKYTMPAKRVGKYTVCPGYFGGFEYSPAAYNPGTHAVYYPALTACLNFNGQQVTIDTKHMSGTMAAIDVTTGKYMWRTQIPQIMAGGALATASNLVFSAADDGKVYAFDAKTGKIVWTANLGVAFGAPPITYEINETQYIAIAAGGFSAAGTTGAATNLGGTLVVFKLHGSPIKKVPVLSSPVTSGLDQSISLKGLTKLNDSIYVSATAKKVVFKVTAAATTNNSGFNFNGDAKGKANFIVPAGWLADFIFKNNQALPHSAAVINTLQYGPHVTPLVATPNPVQGLTGTGTQYAGFTAYGPGKYYLVCLVPGHIQAGMWDHFTVSPTAKMPSIQVSK